MTWIPFGLRRNRVAKQAPEALVALLHDRGSSAATLTTTAARWAATVRTTAFLALDGMESLYALSVDFQPNTPRELEATPESNALDCAAPGLRRSLEQQLQSRGLDASQLVLVGFGYGGTLALHLVLHHGWSCAGVLSFCGRLGRPLPRILRMGSKIRLIDCASDGHIAHRSVRDDVTSLAARGIDARGIALSATPFSDEAIRHGGAYLAELVATAQRGDRSQVEQESIYA
jgi:predicted esterase